MPALGRILVIDDEAPIRESLEMFLQEKGLASKSAGTGGEGLAAFLAFRPQVIILDIRLPDISGLEVLKRIVAHEPDAKVIIITAYHDMETTIEAMRNGAYDYIHKPIDVDELDRAVTRSLRIAETAHSSPEFVPGHSGWPGRHQIVGSTPGMRSLFKTIGLLSRNRATVLIEGETGSGKELIAHVIHESSALKDHPYVTVDCTTLVGSLFESELFGYERGAFTGADDLKRGRLETAGEGTIFFDEVGDLPLALQSKLLRFLEYREYTRLGGTQTYSSKARIIAATNHNLAEDVAKGQFRQDLLFRLNVLCITVPPLRERLDDLPELVAFFLAGINRDLGTQVTRVEKAVMPILRAHSWPGNVRELKNVLTKAALEARGSLLAADAVEYILARTQEDTLKPAPRDVARLDDLQKDHIVKAMNATSGNLSAAARMLGVSRPTLRKRLKKYGIRE